MATVGDLVRSERSIRASAASLGDALASVGVYAEPALARAVQAEQNLWDRIDAEFGLLTASEAGRRLGSRSGAPRNLAASQRRGGLLVAVQRGHQILYPGFQFSEDGSALMVIGRLRSIAQDHERSETGVVQWLCSPTTYLADSVDLDGGARPVDLLVSAPELVVEAAERSWGVDW